MNVDINTVPPHSGRSVFTFAEETALLFVIVVALSQCGQFQLKGVMVDKDLYGSRSVGVVDVAEVISL